MRLDGFGQLELNERALQVVFRIFHFEVDIPRDVIGKEAQTQFKGEQTNRIVQERVIGVGQEGAGLGEVTFQNRRANFRVEANRLPILRVLSERVTARTQ